MALRKQEESTYPESLGGQKAKQVFGSKEAKEKKILTTFSIEPSFRHGPRLGCRHPLCSEGILQEV